MEKTKSLNHMEEQVKIEIICDKGYVADELRRIANVVEEDEEETRQYESDYSVAEFIY